MHSQHGLQILTVTFIIQNVGNKCLVFKLREREIYISLKRFEIFIFGAQCI